METLTNATANTFQVITSMLIAEANSQTARQIISFTPPANTNYIILNYY